MKSEIIKTRQSVDTRAVCINALTDKTKEASAEADAFVTETDK